MDKLDINLKITETLKDFSYQADWFGTQESRKEEVSELVCHLRGFLNERLGPLGFKFCEEYKPSMLNRDRIDIFGESSDSEIFIEVDTYRKDQIAYKFLSRVAISNKSKKTIYISFLYPKGNAKHSVGSAKRTLSFSQDLTKQLINARDFYYIGCCLDDDGNIEIIDYDNQ